MDVVERQKRLFGRVGVGRLRIVDEQHPAQPADLLHAMRKAGKRLERARDVDARSTPSARAAAKAKAAFCPLWAPRSARALREIGQRFGLRRAP